MTELPRPAEVPPFAERLLSWAAHHGRHDLPWQRERSAYRVWVSEVMLQQTQVATVIPYFERFMRRFPNLVDLAAGSEAEVLALWAGLGYYARARNLHRAARALAAAGARTLPREQQALETLPGLGRSTAAAVLALTFGDRHPILDGNVKRVLARHRGIEGPPSAATTLARLWQAADACTPDHQVAAYTQAIMDLGAMVCTRSRPACAVCPVAADCIARNTARTNELPTPRTRRPQPWRERWALLLINPEGACWLERRPPTGIWGGLLAPPEFCSREALDDWCRLQGQDDAPEALAPIEHTFTHFRLRLHPCRLRVRKALNFAPASLAGATPGPTPRPATKHRGDDTERITAKAVAEAKAGLWYRPDPGPGALGPGLPAPIARLLADPSTR